MGFGKIVIDKTKLVEVHKVIIDRLNNYMQYLFFVKSQVDLCIVMHQKMPLIRIFEIFNIDYGVN